MPELPEVETVVRGLRKVVLNKKIAKVYTNAPDSSIVISESLKRDSFESLLIGKTILSISRRGKNILIDLSSQLVLWVHLKMTGHFFYVPKTKQRNKHDLVIFSFHKTRKNITEYHLRFNDYRRFGRLRLYRKDELLHQSGLSNLGPEPFDISPDEFVELCYRRPRMLKSALLDQTFIAGIGNIYADESLYASRLHPQRLTTSISKRKIIELHGHIQRILSKAIELMGTSVDSYSGVNGKRGSFQTYLLAYNQEGKQCSRCTCKIIRKKIGARSAHYCPRCQKAPSAD